MPWPATIAFVAVTLVVTTLVARPWIAVVAGLAALALVRAPVSRVVVLVAAPTALLLSRAVDRPEFGWLALGLFAVVIVADRVQGAAPEADYGHVRMPEPADATPAP